MLEILQKFNGIPRRIRKLDVHGVVKLIAVSAAFLLTVLGFSSLEEAYVDPQHAEYELWIAAFHIALAIAMFAIVVTEDRAAQLAKNERRASAAAKKRISLQLDALDQHAILSETDPQGRYRNINENFVKLFGYSKADIIGRDSFIIYPDGRHDPMYETVRSRLAEGKSFHGEQTLVTSDGRKVFCTATVFPRFDAKGNHTGTVTVRTDITDLHKAESNRVLTSMLRGLQDEIYLYTVDTLQLIYVNDAGLERCEWTPEEVKTKHIYDTSPGFDLQVFREHVKPLLSGDAKVVRIAAKHEKGYVEISTHLHTQADDVPIFVSVLRDVTEARLREKQRLETVASISHELRSPLTSIKGSLRLLLSGMAGQIGPEALKLVDIADRNSERMLLVLNDILDLEKLMARKMEFEIAPLPLADFIAEAVEINKGYGVEHHVKFVAADVPKHAQVEGDRARLMQVMTNLMSNAAKYSPEGADVTIWVSDQGNAWRVNVTDRGPGIPREARDKVFESFGQVAASDGKVRKGTGLGLAICEKIVKAHRGKIDFESEVGKGSTFFFELAKSNAEREPRDQAHQIAAE